jgi:hypothetical protein
MADNKDNTGSEGSTDEQKQESKTYRDILLESLKSKGKDGANWVERLANDTQEALGKQATLKLPGNYRDLTVQESVTTWMDKIFDLFLDYAYDFNPAVTGSDLEVSWDRPVLFHSISKQGKWGDGETKSWAFKGSLATRSWSLVMRGTKEQIQGHIVPNDQVIALSSSENYFKPYLEMMAQLDRSAVKWTIDGIEIPSDRVGEVAQDLFGALIRVSRGEQKDDEKSHLHVSSHKAPPPVPHQSLTGKYKVFSTAAEQSESMKLSFSPEYVPKRNDLLRPDESLPKQKSDKPSAAEALAKKLAQENAERKAKATETQKVKALKAAQQAPQAGVAKAPDSSTGESSTKQVEKEVCQDVVEPETSADEKKISEKVESGAEPVADGKQISLWQVCDLLLAVIDRDLEELSKQGVDAFTQRDMAVAQEVLKKSTNLSTFKDQVAALMSQWKNQL